MGLWIPEINQNSVAHIACDKPAKTFDRLGNAAVIDDPVPAIDEALSAIAGDHEGARRASGSVLYLIQLT